MTLAIGGRGKFKFDNLQDPKNLQGSRMLKFNKKYNVKEAVDTPNYKSNQVKPFRANTNQQRTKFADSVPNFDSTPQKQDINIVGDGTTFAGRNA